MIRLPHERWVEPSRRARRELAIGVGQRVRPIAGVREVREPRCRRLLGRRPEAPPARALVEAALAMAVESRRPEGRVVHHSDQGSQYTSLAFGERCRESGIARSMGSVGDAYDNAMCESFFATLECELIWKRSFRAAADARREVFGFIEGFYNTRRLHSALGYASPLEFERNNRAA